MHKGNDPVAAYDAIQVQSLLILSHDNKEVMGETAVKSCKEEEYEMSILDLVSGTALQNIWLIRKIEQTMYDQINNWKLTETSEYHRHALRSRQDDPEGFCRRTVGTETFVNPKPNR